MNRRASAVWEGSLKEGKGRFSSESGKLSEVPFNWGQRFGEEKGTNPEELIAAAHAACFSMASSAEMGKVGITPQRIDTKATIVFDKGAEGFTLTTSNLEVTVKAPGADRTKVQQALDAAKKGCPISRVLNLTINLQSNIQV